MKYDAIN